MKAAAVAPARLMMSEIVAQRGLNAGDDIGPVAAFVLSKQPRRRIPRTILPIEKPAPAGIVAIKQPKRLANGAGSAPRTYVP